MTTTPGPLWLHLLGGQIHPRRRLVRIGPPLEFVNRSARARTCSTSPAAERSRAARTWADVAAPHYWPHARPLRPKRCSRAPDQACLIASAQRQGFTVALYVVALGDPQRLLGRVAQRVREGGHRCRPNASWRATRLALLAQAVRQADVAYLYDVAEVRAGGPQLVAVRSAGNSTPVVAPLPAWAQAHAGVPSANDWRGRCYVWIASKLIAFAQTWSAPRQ